MRQVNVVCVDDDEDLRVSLGEFIIINLQEYSGDTMQVNSFKGCKDGEDFLEYVQQGHPIDIVILDLEMPKVNGIGVLKICKELNLNFNFIIFTAKNNSYFQKEIEEFNIKGSLSKPSNNKEFFETIMIALAGGSYTCPEHLDIRDTLKNLKKKPTTKELEVAHHVNTGLMEKEIAEKLKTTESSVKHTKKRLKDKFGFNNFNEVLEFLKFKKQD